MEAEKKVRMLTTDLQRTQVEAAKKEAELKAAQEQIRMLTKEKGMAMRDNAASYEQSIQRDTQVSTHTHTHAHTHTDTRFPDNVSIDDPTYTTHTLTHS